MQILNRSDIPPHVQREVLNEFENPRKDSLIAIDNEWKELLARVRHSRTMLMTNKTRWSPELAPLYQEYIDIMSIVVQKVQEAAAVLDETGKPISIEAFTKRRADENKRREAQGKRPLAKCGTRWQDWVPAHVRSELMLKVENAYGVHGSLRGARFVPFITREIKKEHAIRVSRIESALKTILRQCANCGQVPPMSDNKTAALYLAARAQALRALNKYKKSADLLNDPCPVNWLHLLEPRMRERINTVRRAQRAGDVFVVPLDWCHTFYIEPINGIEGAAPHTMDDALFDAEETDNVLLS